MPEGQEGVQVPQETEQIIATASEVTANSYTTRRIKTVNVGGVSGQWHLLKGGMRQDGDITPSPEKPEKDIKYEILYNPETNTWLKTLPFEGMGLTRFDAVTDRLKRSFVHQKRALEVAGLTDLSEQAQEVEVEADGKTVYGFTMPHIGPSLEHIIYHLKGNRNAKEDLPPEALELIKNVYPIAADMAEKLYLEHGTWTSDPNPGNVLLRRDEKGGVHVVLIDFATNMQDQEYLLDNTPQGTYSDQGYQDRLRGLLANRVRALHQGFIGALGNYKLPDGNSLPFERDPKAVRANIENSATLRNVRERLSPPSVG